MAPSPIRPTSSNARRTRLLAASALCGVAAALAAQPALAQTLPGIPGGGSITVSSGGTAPVITAPDPNTLDIDLNASRTVINWSSLHVSGADTMTFHFDAASDIVLNKTTTQIAIDLGATVSGLVGASAGGNIWFYSPQGVIVSPGANMSAGGFLFSKGSSLSDVSFVGAADPVANIRAATDALIQMTTVSTATSASIDAAGNVLLSRSGGGNLVADIVEGATATMSTTSNSITVDEMTATSGAATITAGGSGATVTGTITGATGVSVSSTNNSSVHTAVTTGSGDILVTSTSGSASLTSGNSGRDITVSAPTVFISTLDAVRDVFVTGTTAATVTNRIFAGDDIEITANGSVTGNGAYLKSTGVGATDDAHILVRSTTSSASANIVVTEGTGVAAGDGTVQGGTSASLGTGSVTKDLKISGVTSASLNNGSAARDVILTATNGTATVTTSATAGDDVVVQASGDILAGGATLKATGTGFDGSVGSMGGSYVYVSSATAAVSVGSAITQGTGSAAGDVVVSADTTATVGSGSASRDLKVGGATASLTDGSAARDVFVDAFAGDATIGNSATAGDDIELTATGGRALAGGATLTSTGIGATDDAHILVRSTTGIATLASGTTQGTGVQAGDITVSAATSASLSVGNSTRDININGTLAQLLQGTAARDIFVTATTGNAIVVTSATAGDDVEVTTVSGNVLAPGTMTSTGVGATDDAHVLVRSTSGTVSAGTARTQGTGVAVGDVTVSGGSTTTLTTGASTRDLTISGTSASLTTGSADRDLFVTATTGPATVTTYAIAGDDLEVTATSGNVAASNANLWATGAGASDDAHVLVRSTTGSVNVLSAQSQGGGAVAGDVTIQAGVTATVAGAAATRNLTITSANSFDLSGLYSANNTASFTSTAGTVTESGGSIAATTLTLNGATGVSLNQINNVVSLGASNSGTGSFTYRDVNNVNLTGNIISGGNVTLISDNGAINQSAGTISGDVLNLTAATGTSLTQENTVNSLGLLTNTTSGTLVFRDADGFDITNDIDSAGGVSLFTTTGDITHSGGTLHAGGFFALDSGGQVTVGDIEADGGVSVSGAGNVDVGSATAGDDINIFSGGGAAILRKAVLTGAGANRDLSVVASGNATLGADDFTSITTDNVFSRTGGSTGTASVRSTTGDAHVYLDSSAGFDSLEGEGVDVTIQTGPASFGTLTANSGDIYVEALDGALTVGSATAAGGDVELYSDGGDDLTITGAVHAGSLVDVESDGLLHLTSTSAITSDDEIVLGGDNVTIEGSVHGDGAVQIGANGLVDGTAAPLISSGDDLSIIAGSVDVDTLQADGQIQVLAAAGTATVQSAHGGVSVQIAATDDVFVGTAQGDDLGVAAQSLGGDTLVNFAKANGVNGVVVVQADGDATLRGAESDAGILVESQGIGTATFGADLGATAVAGVNYAVTATGTGVPCGCGFPLPDGLQVVSAAGDAVVNVYSLSNPIAVVTSGSANNATVTLSTGDLKIDQLSGYNITVDAQGGSLETGLTTSFGGDYTITAQDFLGDALTPTLDTGLIHDVTITDTLGDLDLGTNIIHADRKLTITAQDGAVLGSAQLNAGAATADGEVTVTANAIAVESVASDHYVTLTAIAGGIDLGAGGGHADNVLTLVSTNGGVTSLGQLSAGVTSDGEINVSAGSSIVLNGVQSDHDVNLTATNGGVDLGSATNHADHTLAIFALNGAVTSTGLIDAGSGLGDGQVFIKSAAITADQVASDGLVSLDGATGLVDVTTSVSAGGNYVLVGGDFSVGALSPIGARAGTWSLTDTAGGFDFSGQTLHYGGGLFLFVNGVVNGGDMSVDSGNIFAQVGSGHLGVLTAPSSVSVAATVGGISVDAINTGISAQVRAQNSGAARLGAATLTGTGANQVIVKANNGDAILGAATAGAITAANLVSSTGATTTVDVTGVGGKVDVNLDHLTGASLTTVSATQAASIKVANGPLTINQLTAGAASSISGGGDTRLVSANVAGDLAVTSTAGALRFGDTTPGRVIAASGDLTLDAATDISQQGVLHANALNVTAGTGVVLLGDNQIAYLGPVDVAAGGFALHSTTGFDLYGPVNAVGQTVDLRSDGAIGQVSTGTITAKTLTGSSVGGADLGAFNQVAELGEFSNTGGGVLRLVEGRSLTINGAVFSTGRVAVTSHGGMTIAATGTVRADGTGDAVTLVSDGVFTNARGSDAVVAGNAAGRWLIYTQAVGDPTGSTAGNSFNGLSGKSFYGSAYDFFNERFAVTPNAGNRFVYAYQPILTVTPVSRTVTYDGTVPTTSTNITGLVNGDTAADAIFWTGAPLVVGATSKNAGTYVLTADLSPLSSDMNYAFVGGTGQLNILRRAVTVTADSLSKSFGQPDPALTYQLTNGSLVAGDAFTGALARDAGDTPGSYGITLGTLALSANYDLTFTGAVLTIKALPSNEMGGGSSSLKYLTEKPEFTLDWTPDANLSTEFKSPNVDGSAGGGKMAALR